jgi:phosphoribosyl 1,2-cyclic phosphodiesterase
MIEITPLASSSKGNCYRVTDGETTLLLECGIRYKDIQIGLNFQMSAIAGCLVTHEHKDHSFAIYDVMKAGIDIYTSQGTADALNLSGHRVKVIEAKQQLKIGSWTVFPFDVQHDVAEPLAFLMSNNLGEKLLFITDTAYCRYSFKGLTHIMLEINYCTEVLNQNILDGITPLAMKSRLMRSHFSLETAIAFFKANDLSKVQEIYILHLSDNNSDEDLIKKTIQRATGKHVIICQR